jgi:hypothetical protein
MWKAFQNLNDKMKKNKERVITAKVIMTAIACITILDAIALMNGHDGILLMTAMSAIAGLAGWTIPFPKFAKNKNI